MIIFTDRSQGVTSLEDGEIEINLERIAGEDRLGVSEELKNFCKHTFKHRLILNSKEADKNFSIFENLNKWNEKPSIFLAITQDVKLSKSQ